ncbi:leucyl/phenylalanyl-tRNA--protein transferase [Haliea sp. E1-2-M8]|uniref:leucyl/phenylalanyl-tRNA--protein transferase n=1 Tax=Haliea sp. E1-2-M8 TaxID=3064706 RepID=UPI002717939B|nr:leucyl/phenylalanyl-tRNA--protein transferase [Haliea sp. E1-2-M8]MDO8862380.1 leucyl/phenylalanyl-tRNA--protein transferase [Haliea sp. E1-2-M8]
MAGIVRLAPGQDFPPTSLALDYPNGLLAAGGGLSPERLLAAYRRGIFPWYEDPQPLLWWTPDPRSVLYLDELHVARSLRKTLRRNQLGLAVDRRFAAVIAACAGSRRGSDGTWIGEDMLLAYQALHRRGIAHSVEVLDQDGRLVGGMYGVAVGRAFFGESMFSRVPSASRVALVALVDILRRGGFRLIDCQVESAHMNTMGARNISRLDFEAELAQTVDETVDPAIWALPAYCGDLLP